MLVTPGLFSALGGVSRTGLDPVQPHFDVMAGGWPVEWQPTSSRQHLEAGGALPTSAGAGVHQGEDLGRWVRGHRLGWGKLTGVQQWMCEHILGIEPAAEDEKPRPRHTQPTSGLPNLTAAQYYQCEGHLNVPRKHVETVLSEDGWELQFRLGAWVSNQRSRATTLSPERIGQLSSIGMRWT